MGILGPIIGTIVQLAIGQGLGKLIKSDPLRRAVVPTAVAATGAVAVQAGLGEWVLGSDPASAAAMPLAVRQGLRKVLQQGLVEMLPKGGAA